MRHIQRNILIVLVLLPLWISGCISEGPQSENCSHSSEKIRFELFTKVDSYGMPVTRAAADEDGVDKAGIWVLVFSGTNENATFIEAVKSDQINNKSYITLTPQETACQLLMLANNEDRFYVEGNGYEFSVEKFEAAFTDKTLAYVQNNMLSAPLASPQTSVPFVGKKLPMSDLVSVGKITVNTAIPQINLKRSVGKLIVVNNDGSNFTLNGITAVVNTPKQSLLYNQDGSLTYNTGSDKVIEYKSDESYTGDISPASDGGTWGNPVYLYESECGESKNNTYLIIRGRYRTDTEDCYYKMAFVDDDQNQLNINRNYGYTFTITAVNGRGYATVKEAKASKASNNLSYLLEVQDNSGYEIIANKDYYVGVTNSHFELYAKNDNAVGYTAFTLITDCKSAVKKSITSLTDGMVIASPPGGTIPVNTTNPCDVTIKVEDSFTEGEIELHLGNLKKIITVRRHVPVAVPPGGTAVISNFHPVTSISYLSAYVVDYPMIKKNKVVEEGVIPPPPTFLLETPQETYWLQLSPGGKPVRNDPHRIYVEDGKIDLHVGDGDGTAGDVYVSANKDLTQRIKVHITR